MHPPLCGWVNNNIYWIIEDILSHSHTFKCGLNIWQVGKCRQCLVHIYIIGFEFVLVLWVEACIANCISLWKKTKIYQVSSQYSHTNLRLTAQWGVTGSSRLPSLSFYLQQQHAVGKGFLCPWEQNKLITATLWSMWSVSQISLKSLCFVSLTEVNLNASAFHSIGSWQPFKILWTNPLSCDPSI